MRKKIALWIGVPIVVVLVATVIYLKWDEAPPNDADLRLPPASLPPDQNAFTYFRQAGEKLQEPDDWDPVVNCIYGDAKVQGNPRTFDPISFPTLLRSNEGAFRYVTLGLACAGLEYERPAADEYDAFPYLSRWSGICRLMCLRAVADARARRPREAFAGILAVVKFGRMLEGARGPTDGLFMSGMPEGLLHYLHGLACEHLAYGAAQGIVSMYPADEAALREFMHGLELMGDNRQELIQALKMEYDVDARGIKDVVAGRGRNSIWGMPAWQRFLMPKLFVLPNQTRRMLADSYRGIIRNVARKPADYEVTWLEQRVMGEGQKFQNWAGTQIAAMHMRTASKTLMESLASRSRNELTRVLIAVRCYSLKHGSLPASLGALVPDYIDKIPEDPFDGKPLRYDASKKIIYSVGEDLQDNGGSKHAEGIGIEGADFILRIEF